MSSFFAVAFLVFLAGTCLAYFVLPKAVRPYWLLVCSYLFYMYDPENAGFVALLLSASAVTWAAALLLERLRVKWMRRVCLVVSLALCVGCLFYYKYFNFFLENLNLFLKQDLLLTRILLPVGISFFTFQQVAWLVDSYRGETAWIFSRRWASVISPLPRWAMSSTCTAAGSVRRRTFSFMRSLSAFSPVSSQAPSSARSI